MGLQHSGDLATGAGGRLPGPDGLAQLLYPATVADFGDHLIAATEQPVEHLGRAKAPARAQRHSPPAAPASAPDGFRPLGGPLSRPARRSLSRGAAFHGGS